MLLVFTPLLVRPALKVVFLPSTHPGSELVAAIYFNLFSLSVRAETYAAA